MTDIEMKGSLKMANLGATGKYYWTQRNPKGPASEPVYLVKPDGTLTGVRLETLQNGWGAYLDNNRRQMEELIINCLNGETPNPFNDAKDMKNWREEKGG